METMQFLRILTHGQITDLSNGFDLDGQPFSIYVRPKSTVTNTDTTVSVQCFCDDAPSAMPVPFNDWTPACIKKIAANAISLSSYDVYWGAGNLKI